MLNKKKNAFSNRLKIENASNGEWLIWLVYVHVNVIYFKIIVFKFLISNKRIKTQIIQEILTKINFFNSQKLKNRYWQSFFQA